MLATLDLGEFLGPLGQLSWACRGCGRLVTADVEPARLLRLLTAGVSLIDDEFGGAVTQDRTDCGAPPCPHDQHLGAGPPFTSQDILTLHELLETDTWVQHLAEPPHGSP
jgi:hypothetical protein